MSTEETKKLTSNNSQNDKEPSAVSFWKLLRFARALDWFLMFFGTLAAIASGAAPPLWSLLLGDMTNALSPSTPSGEMVDQARKAMINFFWGGLGMFGACSIAVAFWMVSGERQAIRFREEYFRALLRQEIGWFDRINPSELTSKIAGECFAIQSGLGEKVTALVRAISAVIAGLVVGFVKGWQLTLILASTVPLLAICGTIFVTALTKQAIMGSKAYAIAGALAEQALSAIRTVVGLGGEEKELNAYRAALTAVKRAVIKYGIYSAFAFGAIYFCNALGYCIGFWVGGVFVGQKRINPVTGEIYNVGEVLTVFLAVVNGGACISQISPAMKAIAQAKVAGGKILAVINRKSEIDHESKKGEKLDSVTGQLEFKDVYFNYPSNKEKSVLKGLDLIIEPNKKTALVGVSGCGKTTCMQLIERFYDPDSGTITLDGKLIKDLNLKWLRENIGYVGQEPVLFSTSVRENMKLAKSDATDQEIIEALEQANAWSFLEPTKSHGKGLDTYVGTGGAQLSGGQKQRIAIARAILKNPKILLLDEATSALDRTNEKLIQNTLDEISKGRTTIVIAHRLSTVRNADKIVLFDNGKIIESGNHEELIKLQGRYYEMQKLQLQPEELSKNKQATAPALELDEDETNLRQGFIKEPVTNKIFPEKPKLELLDAPLISMKGEANVESKTENVKDAENLQIVKIETEKGPLLNPTSDPSSPHDRKEFSKDNDDVVTLEKGLTAEEKRAIHEKQGLEKKQLKKDKRTVMRKLHAYAKPERFIFYLAVLAAIFNGTIIPFYSVPLSHFIQTISTPDSPDFMSETRFLGLMFLVLAFGSLIFYGVSLSLFTVISENLTVRLQADVYHKMLRMDMSWHDKPENNPGALVSTLASATAVNTLTSTGIGVMLQMISSFSAGIVISFIGSWRVALVGAGLAPFMFISNKLQANAAAGFAAKTDEAYRKAGVYVMEALTNMRTVASLGKEKEILNLYSKALLNPKKSSLMHGFISGMLFGIAQICGYFVFGISFYVGSLFMRDYGESIGDVFQGVFGIMFATWDAGNAMIFVSDAAKATRTAKSLFEVLETPSKIDYKNSDGKCKEPIQGDIKFKDVTFKYPAREKLVLDNLSFKATSGSKIALVGRSGCGKSTIVQLLQRFYDVDQGEILLDGRNIKEYDIAHLRRHYGTVSQEPVVFNGTIAENIRYLNLLIYFL